jgi:hypothetical protein
MVPLCFFSGPLEHGRTLVFLQPIKSVEKQENTLAQARFFSKCRAGKHKIMSLSPPTFSYFVGAWRQIFSLPASLLSDPHGPLTRPPVRPACLRASSPRDPSPAHSNARPSRPWARAQRERRHVFISRRPAPCSHTPVWAALVGYWCQLVSTQSCSSGRVCG